MNGQLKTHTAGEIEAFNAKHGASGSDGSAELSQDRQVCVYSSPKKPLEANSSGEFERRSASLKRLFEMKPNYVDLLRDEQFTKFLSAEGILIETPEELVEQMNREEKVKGEKWASLQLEEVDCVRRQFLKFVVLFVDDQFEIIKLNLLFCPKDIADKRNESADRLMKKLGELNLIDKIIRVETTCPTITLFKTVAEQLRLVLVKPMAN